MSKPPVYAIRSWLWVVAALAGAALVMTAYAPAQAQVSASAVPASVKPSSGYLVAPPGDLARRVEVPGGRKSRRERRGGGLEQTSRDTLRDGAVPGLTEN